MDKEYLINAEYFYDGDYYSISLGVCHMEAEAKVYIDALRNKEDWIWNKTVLKIFGNPEDIPYNLMFCMREIEVLSLCQKHPNT